MKVQKDKIIGEMGSEFPQNSAPKGFGLSFNKRHYYARTVLSGRTALDLIIRDIIIKKGSFSIYMPSYCCQSMIIPFVINNIDIHFYRVDYYENTLFFDFDFFNEYDVVYILDYFGYKSDIVNEIIIREQSRGKIIIFDITHSYFCNYSNFYPDYMLMSFRKWFDSNCGVAYKYKNDFSIQKFNQVNDKYVELKEKAYYMKKCYIEGDVNIEKNDFLSLFKQAEYILDTDFISYQADKLSEYKINNIDKNSIIKKRRENAQILLSYFISNKSIYQLVFSKINIDDVPLCVPIVVNKEERNNIHKLLIKNNIFCPIHWPITDYHDNKYFDDTIYGSEISIICDQRYGKNEMQRIIEVLDKYKGI